MMEHFGFWLQWWTLFTTLLTFSFVLYPTSIGRTYLRNKSYIQHISIKQVFLKSIMKLCETWKLKSSSIYTGKKQLFDLPRILDTWRMFKVVMQMVHPLHDPVLCCPSERDVVPGLEVRHHVAETDSSSVGTDRNTQLGGLERETVSGVRDTSVELLTIR